MIAFGDHSIGEPTTDEECQRLIAQYGSAVDAILEMKEIGKLPVSMYLHLVAAMAKEIAAAEKERRAKDES